MSKLLQEIQRTAENAVTAFQERAGVRLDYSEGSLAAVEQLLHEASEFFDDLPDDQITTIVEFLGCYILEVGRRAHGGNFYWMEEQDEPVLVVGEPECSIAMATWGKVRVRLAGDPADNIPFFYAGFAELAKKREPGKRAIFI